MSQMNHFREEMNTMKRMLMGAMLVAAFGSPAFANTYGRPLAGTAHDFTNAYGGLDANGAAKNYQTSTTGQGLGMCRTCHTPHNTTQSRQLWARAVDLSQGANFKVYDAAPVTDQNGNVTYNQDGTLAYNDAGVDLTGNDSRYLSQADFVLSGSGRCLSCHDGVTAIGDGVVMNTKDGNDPNLMLLGRDLSKNHPVGRIMPWGTEGFFASLQTGYAGAPSGDPKALVLLDKGGSVGCTSCHSMHRGDPAPGVSNDDYRFLRQGDVCLACHNK